MKRRSLGMNTGLNVIRTLLTMLFPVITFSHISNIFSVDTVGGYSFANGTAGYFIMFAALGISTYAVREGVAYRNDFVRMSEFGSQIFTINLVSTVIAYALLGISVFVVPKFAECRTLLLILSVNIILMTLGCDWVHMIYEDFLFITIRTIIIYLLALLLFFLLVQTPEDLYAYAWITVLATSGAQLLNIPARRKYCRILPTALGKTRHHLKPILILFANTVTTSLYVNSDLLILGFMRSDYEVGLYSVTVKIYMLFKALLGAAITVITPRLSALQQEVDPEAFAEAAGKILRTLVTVLLPVATGILFLDEPLILLISNEQYLGGLPSLHWLGGALVVSIIGWFMTACILIPAKQDGSVLKITMLAAALNVGLNLILIPMMGFVAAAITTLLSEGIACILGCVKARKIMNLKNLFPIRFIIAVFAGCAGVAGMCLLTRALDAGPLISAGVSFLAAMPVYAGITTFLGNEEAIDALNRGVSMLLAKEDTEK